MTRPIFGMKLHGQDRTITAFLVRESAGRYREIPGLLNDWRLSAEQRAQLRRVRFALWTPLVLCTFTLLVWQTLSQIL